MKQEIINGGNARYLGELERFKDGIPFGIVNKTKTDVGGTYVAANCSSNYIIVCPFKDLVDSIAADRNNRYEAVSYTHLDVYKRQLILLMSKH